MNNLEKNTIKYLEIQKNNSKSLTDTSKELHIKRNTLNNFLIDEKFCFRSPEVNKIVAYEKYRLEKGGKGLFYVEGFGINPRSGRENIQTKITPYGIEYFRKLLKKKGLI